MTVTDEQIQKSIRNLLHGDDYRYEILQVINAEFLQYVLSLFEKIVYAKIRHLPVDIDWYKAEFLSTDLHSDDIIINSGLNKKTVSNMYNTARRDVVIEASQKHYKALLEMINDLVDQSNELDVKITLKMGDVSVDLNMNESLIVINTLACKRAELRGGAWSSIGKQVEKALLITLCRLYSVPRKHYTLTGLSDSKREVDFLLYDRLNTRYRCEVKLMGKGNPESADVFHARDSQVFIADKLSALNKSQLDNNGL